MKHQKITAEVSILERIKHLLEEGSVSHVIQQDDEFASFIEKLYQTVDDKSSSLLAVRY